MGYENRTDVTADLTRDATRDVRSGSTGHQIGGRAGETIQATPNERAFVDLLGETRATILRLLKRDGEMSAPELAETIGISDVAVRRHIGVLSDEGLIADRTVNQGRGRPVAVYRLSDRGEQLFPHRYDDVAGELLEFLRDREGRAGVRAFLRWRQDREAAAYSAAVDASDLGGRLEQLAEALCCAGYEAEVSRTDDGYELRQTHCAVYEIARDNPEMCAHEAAAFRAVLGDEVKVTRRRTLAKGDGACVCTVRET